MSDPHRLTRPDSARPERPPSVAAAIESGDVLAFVMDVAGNVSGVSGGFTPVQVQGGTLLEALGMEALDTKLMEAFIGAIALGTTTTATFPLGGVTCHALCCPLAGTEAHALVVIAPDYSVPVSAATPTADANAIDLVAVLADWRDPLATMPGGKELFVWAGTDQLMVTSPRRTILQILDQMLEAPLAAHGPGDTSVLTARPLMESGEQVIELRMRTYTSPVPYSVARALEAIYAELSAASGVPVFLESDERRLDVVAHLPIRTRVRGASIPHTRESTAVETERPIPLAR